MEEGHRALGVMEKHLALHDFFAADRYTIADIALYAYTHVAHLCDYDLRVVSGDPRMARTSRRRRAGHVTMDANPADADAASAGIRLPARGPLSTPWPRAVNHLLTKTTKLPFFFNGFA